MSPLTITHAAGARVLSAYALEPESMRYATRSEPNVLPGTPTIKWGDKSPLPTSFALTVWISDVTLPAANSLAYVIAGECESATFVSTHEGVRAVAGLLSYQVIPDGGAWVRLVLEFAPRGPESATRIAYVVGEEPNLSDLLTRDFLTERGYEPTIYAHNETIPSGDAYDLIWVSNTSFVSYASLWVGTSTPLILAHAGVLVGAGIASANRTAASAQVVSILNEHPVAGGLAVGAHAITTEPVSIPFANPNEISVGFVAVAEFPTDRAPLVAGSVGITRKVLVPAGANSMAVAMTSLHKILEASLLWVLS